MANKRWLGQAAATYDLWTVSLSGTVTSQTYTMTCNAKTVTFTAGGGDTVSTVLAGLATAWSASVNPEMQELTAAALPAGGPYTSLTLTGKTLGKPSTVSVSTSGGATFSITNTTAATGPNDFNNGQNWSGGSAPANSDVLYFDNGSIPCKYNLSTSLTGVTVYVNNGYTGAIGLPAINSDATTTYAEYRTQYLTLSGGTAIINSTGVTRCNLAFGSSTSTVRVLATGQRPQPGIIPVVLITGGNSSSALYVSGGDAATAYYAGTTANFPTISVAAGNNGTLFVGAGTTNTTLLKGGGVVTTNASATTITQTSAGGTLTVGEAAAVTTLNVQGGTCYVNTTGTVATINVSNGAILSFDGDPRAKTVTNAINLYGDKTTVIDNQKAVNSGVLTVNHKQIASFNIQHGVDNAATYT